MMNASSGNKINNARLSLWENPNTFRHQVCQFAIDSDKLGARQNKSKSGDQPLECKAEIVNRNYSLLQIPTPRRPPDEALSVAAAPILPAAKMISRPAPVSER